MTTLRFADFGGMVPRLGKRNLPPNAATVADNTKLLSGELRPIFGLLPLSTVADQAPATVFHFEYNGGDYFISFDIKTWVVQSPLLNDSFERIFWTNATGMWENTKPRIIAGQAPYKVGVPPPSGFMNGTTSGGTPDFAEQRIYTTTFVTGFNEEGPPGNALSLTGNTDGGTWTINGIDALTTPAGTWDNITKIRLYRTITTLTGVDFRLVDEWTLAAAPATYNDTVPDETLASRPLLESYNWAPPPVGLDGLIASSGFLVGFTGRNVFVSEAYRPWAWPPDYQVGVEDDVVALGAYGNNVVIATSGNPYVISGATPDAISLSRIKAVLPCLSAGSLVSTVASVIYASENGLVSVSDAGTSIITKSHITRDEWQEVYSPDTIKAAVYDDRYLGMINDSQGFIMGFDDPMTALSYVFLDGVSSVDTSSLTGQAMLGINGQVYAFDENTQVLLLYTWRSKDVVVPKPTNFGAIQIRGTYQYNAVNPDPPLPPGASTALFGALLYNVPLYNQGVGVIPFSQPQLPIQLAVQTFPIAVKLYGDDILRWTGVIADSNVHRLPSGYKATEWSVSVSGSAGLYSIAIAETAKELEQVT